MPDSDRELDRERRHRERERRHSRTNDEDAAQYRERRQRKGHAARDSEGNALPRAERESRFSTQTWELPAPRTPRDSTPPESGEATPATKRSRGSKEGSSRGSGSGAPLSLDALERLDKANQKKAGWRAGDYDEEYLKEVRRREKDLERERVGAAREERRRERERARARAQPVEAEELVKKKGYDSDFAAQEEARVRREKRRRERERERRKGYTDDEREGGRKKGYTNIERERERRKEYTDDERERKRVLTDTEREERRRAHEQRHTPSELEQKKERRREEKRLRTEQKKRRVISGPLAEEGAVDDDYDDEDRYMMEKRGGAETEPSEYTEEELARKKKLKRIIIGVVAFLILLAIIIPVGVLASKKHSKNDSGSAAGSGSGSSEPANSNLKGVDPNSVPTDKKGTIYDPFSWYDTTDFNLKYTDKTVGGLPLMGLNDTWDDDVQANDKVPKLSDDFGYGKTPIRGINVGGWLNLEPFITPSFFEKYSQRDNIVDEWTLCTKLGSQCKGILEKHYATFVTRQTFIDIRNAGFDHVRIPFGYWAVTTYDGDVYVKQVSWRYLLRGIEYARQNGLRVNLDLHGAPGSQNGWNHSGRQGVIGWLNGTDGDLNAQRTLDIHHQLSQFFAQPRYKNVVTMYGLVNEPRMVDISTQSVLAWTQKAIDQIRKDGITAILIFGDGFFGLDNWQGKLQTSKNLLLDVHQYVIFNVDQLSLNHTKKLNFACRGWTQQSRRSMDTTTGFGPTMCAEWSQADTDCTQYINNVNIGTRWEGTYDTGNASTSVLKPQCYQGQSCSCTSANADPGGYSDAYKKWLYQFAIAQMISFEVGWGWFYWTWDTEKATQWSWKKGMAAGILPQKVWERDFDCPDDLEDFGRMGLPESY